MSNRYKSIRSRFKSISDCYKSISDRYDIDMRSRKTTKERSYFQFVETAHTHILAEPSRIARDALGVP